ncbi:MAG TPA: hypothetical protein VK196_22745 [Magnetospirillum sp.]|nr:hypothetical protein [Magnetospirillum sp.]
MTASAAERIRTLIDVASKKSSASGRTLDLAQVYVTVLVRCGICREDATQLVADNDQDPISRILHFAGDSHNFAVLAVEEALAAA